MKSQYILLIVIIVGVFLDFLVYSKKISKIINGTIRLCLLLFAYLYFINDPNYINYGDMKIVGTLVFIVVAIVNIIYIASSIFKKFQTKEKS